MIIKKEAIQNAEQRWRANLINSLAGFRQAVLIGTKSSKGITNLAIFNSLIHIGANPALYGFICRPDSVRRDTLRNITETGVYTLNYVKTTDLHKAHQTSAKYDQDISEFSETGFTEQYIEGFAAPFVREAVVKFSMQLEDIIPIKLNETLLVIGSVQSIELEEKLISPDGFVSLEKSDALLCSGLDAYYSAVFLERLPYARPEKK
jgi:flavin reductase (DIM6/NTAB) family NADH-FMN oxidoreductase RutF